MSLIDKNKTNLILLENNKAEYVLYDLNLSKNKDFNNIDILILYSSYNLSINESIRNGFLNTLSKKNYSGSVAILQIPGGAFELPQLSKKIIKSLKPKISLLIGCIVKGETKHYDFLSSSVTNAISILSMKYHTSILNGIQTVENDQQAIDRAGNKFNKGSEYADVSLEILNFIEKFNE